MSTEKLITIEELQTNLLDAYRKEFPNDQPNICAFAPGRVNLIGEHSDYNDGFVFPMATPVGTMILGQALDDTENTKCYFRTLTGNYNLTNVDL
jgi:galactokinase